VSVAGDLCAADDGGGLALPSLLRFSVEQMPNSSRRGRSAGSSACSRPSGRRWSSRRQHDGGRPIR